MNPTQHDGFARPQSIDQVEAESNRFIWRVYRWMSVGLLVTGLVSLFITMSPELREFPLRNRGVFYVLLFAELAMVWSFSSIARKASASVAMALFLIYAAMNGATLSVIFLVYTASSVANVFFISTATFGAM